MVLYIKLEKNTEQKLRENAMKRFGYGKGAITDAVNEAVGMWLASKFVDIPKEPLSALRGLLKNVKASSVELKHAGAGLFIK